MNQSGNNWSKSTSKFAFAHNTSVNYTTGHRPYQIVFGTKPQVPMTLKLGLLRDKNKQCKPGFGDGLQSHTQSENNMPNNSLTVNSNNSYPTKFQNGKTSLKTLTGQTIRDAVRLRQKYTGTKTDFNSDDLST